RSSDVLLLRIYDQCQIPSVSAAAWSQIRSSAGLLFITMQSLAQFTQILGMLALFAALVVEWTAVELLRTRDATRTSFLAASLLRQLPRFTGIAVALILVSGMYLAAQFGLLRSPWLGVSFTAMVLMAGLGGAALRPLIRSLGSGGRGTLEFQPTNKLL